MRIDQKALKEMREDPVIYYLARSLSLFQKMDVTNARRRRRVTRIIQYLRDARRKRV